MRELAVAGLIALAFGVGSWYATRDASGALGWFQRIHIGAGLLALLVATAWSARRLGSWAQPGPRAVLGRGLLGVLAAFLVALALERAADRWGGEFDWTLEQKFELSEATRRALDELRGRVVARLYYDDEDPRVRSTRLLLRALERAGGLPVEERRLDEHPEDADRYAISASNTVVLLSGEHFETVGRPGEGTLYEALYRLRSVDAGLLYVAQGAGEGEIERSDPEGFSGFGQALLTEGYRIRSFVAAQGVAIPPELAALVWIAPRRPLPEPALAAARQYLTQGGRLVAFLEPGVESGLGGLLAEWGIGSPDAVLVDPASGRMEGDAPGVNPLAYAYGTHPIAHGLGPGRMTFFRGARSFELRKPQPEDALAEVVLASPRSWLAPDAAVLDSSRAPVQPAAAESGYHALVVAGRYLRDGHETRIAAFGDSDFASNRQLRTLYNLDLVLNAVHWVAEREPELKLLPKARVSGGAQFALPIQNTLTRFYGIGMLLPEALLITGAVIWLRTRNI